jgi:hypothetical protein
MRRPSGREGSRVALLTGYQAYDLHHYRTQAFCSHVSLALVSRIVCPWRLETARVRQLATMTAVAPETRLVFRLNAA